MSNMLDSILLDHSSGILMLVDPASMQICEASKPTLGLLGFRREELIGRRISEIEVDLADTCFWDDVHRVGMIESRSVQGSYRCANGEILAASKTVSRVHDGDDCNPVGQPGGNHSGTANGNDGSLFGTGLASDGASKAVANHGGGREWFLVRAEPLPAGPAVEEQFAAAAAMLRATLEATADGVLVIDRDGAIVNMNRRFARLWKLPEAMLLAHDDPAIFDFMAACFNDPAAYRAALQAIRLDPEAEAFDLLQLSDGRFFERSAMPARQGREIFGRVFSFNDITGQKLAEAARSSLEAQLRESQKMEAIGTLAGGIAHDFNNILATILGNTELARQDLSLNALALESLDEIRKAGARARDLVQQILSFSRRQPTARRRVELAAIVKESERLLRATLPARLLLAVDCDTWVPPVLADVTQIEQVVLNLATNAMQAMHGRPGRIDIRLDTALLEPALAVDHPALAVLLARSPGRVARLVVSDDGCGMDAATRARIFEPFFTTKAVDEGTGLGLSVVLGIVQAHEGVILVDSEPGQGTSFTLYLPLAGDLDHDPAAGSGTDLVDIAAPPGAAPAAAATMAIDAGAGRDLPVVQPGPPPAQSAPANAMPPTARKVHILYVDDDASLVFLVTRLLERRGFRISAFTDQDEALAALRAAAEGVDLLVTDYNMPGMSGLDVTREALRIRADLAVVVASGFIDETLHTDAAAAGVMELVFKADAVETLCEALARLALAEVEKRNAGGGQQSIGRK